MTTNRDLYIVAIFFMFYIAKVEARRVGFLYLCIGSGCEPWQIALMVVTIILFLFCCCAGACLKSKKNARSDQHCKVYLFYLFHYLEWLCIFSLCRITYLCITIVNQISLQTFMPRKVQTS